MQFAQVLRHRLLPGGIVLALAAPVAAQSFTTIEVPDSTATVPIDINASGDMVGRYTSALDRQEHGFLRTTHGETMSIDYPGANFTVAAGINARGDIVGQFRLPTDPVAVRRGFVLSAGQFIEINPAGSLFTNVLGVGLNGDVVGRYCTILPCNSDVAYVHGFLYSEGEFVTLDVPGASGTNAWKMTPQGQIIGGYTDNSGEHRIFMLTRDGFANIDVPGVLLGTDNGAINTHGEVVGFYCDNKPCNTRSPDTHGFRLRSGEFTSIDVPGATNTVSFSINPRGDIVGFYLDTTGRAHGFLLTGLQ